ncbi:epoxide hydrolase family protein [Pseudooceanicola aestuarii]|uniref:epoxide hydrolase family protein n=1 Tax=Pseudooceanicola aestuarii TaxID=2697319 RepID=UPI0013D35DF0|nr:epoxide hydrolase family protein [Pseudooceanicola aestuarii]
MLQPTPFQIHATDADLADLRDRLTRTRWPDPQVVTDWSQGTPLAYLQEFTAHWARNYDWRARERALNALPHWRAEVEGLGLHFVHARSAHPEARPLLLLHGWPGSFVEFRRVIPRLVDPVAHGGRAEDAFHVVVPSLPGFGFSDKPRSPGFGAHRIAAQMDALMRGLGYGHYGVQGGDWGSVIATCIAAQNLGACTAVHVNMVRAMPGPEDSQSTDPATRRALQQAQAYQDWDSGYAKQQATRPQTLGYALADSPVGQAAWILEKFWRWSDCDGLPENAIARDELLDNIMIYWLSNSATSSARLYWESFGKPILDDTGPVTLPAGVSVFPAEIIQSPRHWADKSFSNITYWNNCERGGHFAAFEQPEIFAREITAFFGAQC